MVSLKDTQLFKGKGGEAFPAADLWRDGPSLIIALRRPGCRELGSGNIQHVQALRQCCGAAKLLTATVPQVPFAPPACSCTSSLGITPPLPCLHISLPCSAVPRGGDQGLERAAAV